MSIRIGFSLEPGRNGLFRKKITTEEAASAITGLAEEMGYRVSRGRFPIIIHLCPEGIIGFVRAKQKISGEVQTNIAGPGFHAAVIEFLEKLAEREQFKLRVFDRTGYYKKRDFQAMKREFFDEWFVELFRLVSTWEGKEETRFCWPDGYYIPDGEAGKLISHIRPFSYREMNAMLNSGVAITFAREFFLWNEIERDMYFYRNCGLVMLNQHCSFKPSERSAYDKRVNDAALEYLEQAVKMEPSIAFPKREYLKICEVAGRQPVDLSLTASMPEDMEIGCRRRLIYRRLGTMMFGLPGSFLFEEGRQDNLDHYYDGVGYGDHDYYVYAASLTGRTAEFKDGWFNKGIPAKEMYFDVGEAKARVTVYEPKEESDYMLYMLSAQVIHEEQRMNIDISWRNPDEEEWALGLVKNIRIISASISNQNTVQ